MMHFRVFASNNTKYVKLISYHFILTRFDVDIDILIYIFI